MQYLLQFSLMAFLFSGAVSAQKPVIYLIPGQGADERLFSKLSLDTNFEIRKIHHITPEKGMTIPGYALALSAQIDTTKPFILVGVSLGGMVATEMGDFLHPEKIIIISSAKCREELPGRYKFQRKMPLYKAVPPRLAKFGAKLLQPIVEPDRNKEKAIFKAMLNDKNPVYMRRSIEMIMRWERNTYRSDIIHIHGCSDHTIPARNVKADIWVKDGSHMMTLTRAAEISALLNSIL